MIRHLTDQFDEMNDWWTDSLRILSPARCVIYVLEIQ